MHSDLLNRYADHLDLIPNVTLLFYFLGTEPISNKSKPKISLRNMYIDSQSVGA